jgi:hypothetical protein
MGKVKLVSKDVGGVVVRIGHGSELNSEFTSFCFMNVPGKES